MPTIKCPQNHRSEATEKQLKEGYTCPECGNNMRMSDVVSSEAKEPPSKRAPATYDVRSQSETDA